MPNKIKLSGRQHNTFDYLAGIDVFLLTSSTEGLPLTLIEALQQGCLPAIALESGLQEVPVDAFGIRFFLGDPSALLKFLSELNKLPLPKLKNLQQETRDFFLKQYDLPIFYCLIHHYKRSLTRLIFHLTLSPYSFSTNAFQYRSGLIKISENLPLVVK